MDRWTNLEQQWQALTPAERADLWRDTELRARRRRRISRWVAGAVVGALCVVATCDRGQLTLKPTTTTHTLIVPPGDLLDAPPAIPVPSAPPTRYVSPGGWTWAGGEG